ncbi:alpha/beta fold hydrolase [Tomitella fengzijianii]|uniref:Alpha/beta hydrolase n=1 Tax=Tomitella fengzijianii TaxID=2597660 RepID=A0A516X198_9ACTN|nr:alpha/beta hydrolase [Tomitella fengzijianii]QDQ96810.1 alpha/beta hydrolase [Tomitella fengzijianii]
MSAPVLTVAPAGVDIAYRFTRAGAAPGADPVLFIHGMGGDSRTWDAVARTARSAGRDVITVDLRGHGRSAKAPSYRFDDIAQDVIGVCDHLGLGSVDIVGHSLGALTATLVAQRRPGLARRLVLEEMPMPLRAGDPVPEVPSHRPTPAELWHALGAMARSPRGVLGFDRGLTEPAMAQFRAPNARWWAALPGLRGVPVLFLRGTRQGSMVDPALLAGMARALPGMAVHEVPCGHSIHRDRRARFEAAVLPFLDASLEPPDGGTIRRPVRQD